MEKSSTPSATTSKLKKISNGSITKRMSQFLGEGGEAEVFVGYFDQPNQSGSGSGQKVAIKCYKQVERRRAALDDNPELKALAGFSHPNIIRLLGYLESERSIELVLEWAEYGSLYSVLHGRRVQLDEKLVAKQIADGLRYLHSQCFFHRDLKSENVLICADGVAKISDFGTAQFKPNYSLATPRSLTMAYVAPESCGDALVDLSRVDIYAVGIILWELATRKVPWSKAAGGAFAPAAIPGHVLSGRRPETENPSRFHSEWRLAIEACWNQNPALRPSASQLVSMTNELPPLSAPENVSIGRRASVLRHVIPQALDPRCIVADRTPIERQAQEFYRQSQRSVQPQLPPSDSTVSSDAVRPQTILGRQREPTIKSLAAPAPSTPPLSAERESPPHRQSFIGSRISRAGNTSAASSSEDLSSKFAFDSRKSVLVALPTPSAAKDIPVRPAPVRSAASNPLLRSTPVLGTASTSPTSSPRRQSIEKPVAVSAGSPRSGFLASPKRQATPQTDAAPASPQSVSPAESPNRELSRASPSPRSATPAPITPAGASGASSSPRAASLIPVSAPTQAAASKPAESYVAQQSPSRSRLTIAATRQMSPKRTVSLVHANITSPSSPRGEKQENISSSPPPSSLTITSGGHAQDAASASQQQQKLNALTKPFIDASAFAVITAAFRDLRYELQVKRRGRRGGSEIHLAPIPASYLESLRNGGIEAADALVLIDHARLSSYILIFRWGIRWTQPASRAAYRVANGVLQWQMMLFDTPVPGIPESKDSHEINFGPFAIHCGTLTAELLVLFRDLREKLREKFDPKSRVSANYGNPMANCVMERLLSMEAPERFYVLDLPISALLAKKNEIKLALVDLTINKQFYYLLLTSQGLWWHLRISLGFCSWKDFSNFSLVEFRSKLSQHNEKMVSKVDAWLSSIRIGLALLTLETALDAADEIFSNVKDLSPTSESPSVLERKEETASPSERDRKIWMELLQHHLNVCYDRNCSTCANSRDFVLAFPARVSPLTLAQDLHECMLLRDVTVNPVRMADFLCSWLYQHPSHFTISEVREKVVLSIVPWLSNRIELRKHSPLLQIFSSLESLTAATEKYSGLKSLATLYEGSFEQLVLRSASADPYSPSSATISPLLSEEQWRATVHLPFYRRCSADDFARQVSLIGQRLFLKITRHDVFESYRGARTETITAFTEFHAKLARSLWLLIERSPRWQLPHWTRWLEELEKHLWHYNNGMARVITDCCRQQIGSPHSASRHGTNGVLPHEYQAGACVPSATEFVGAQETISLQEVIARIAYVEKCARIPYSFAALPFLQAILLGAADDIPLIPLREYEQNEWDLIPSLSAEKQPDWIACSLALSSIRLALTSHNGYVYQLKMRRMQARRQTLTRFARNADADPEPPLDEQLKAPLLCSACYFPIAADCPQRPVHEVQLPAEYSAAAFVLICGHVYHPLCLPTRTDCAGCRSYRWRARALIRAPEARAPPSARSVKAPTQEYVQRFSDVARVDAARSCSIVRSQLRFLRMDVSQIHLPALPPQSHSAESLTTRAPAEGPKAALDDDSSHQQQQTEDSLQKTDLRDTLPLPDTTGDRPSSVGDAAAPLEIDHLKATAQTIAQLPHVYDLRLEMLKKLQAAEPAKVAESWIDREPIAQFILVRVYRLPPAEYGRAILTDPIATAYDKTLWTAEANKLLDQWLKKVLSDSSARGVTEKCAFSYDLRMLFSVKARFGSRIMCVVAANSCTDRVIAGCKRILSELQHEVLQRDALATHPMGHVLHALALDTISKFCNRLLAERNADLNRRLVEEIDPESN